MKYIFLIASVIFGVAGISQAMDELFIEAGRFIPKAPLIFNLECLSISFQPAPDFVRILVLSAGFFSLFLIWRKLKSLNIGKLWEYDPC